VGSELGTDGLYAYTKTKSLYTALDTDLDARPVLRGGRGVGVNMTEATWTAESPDVQTDFDIHDPAGVETIFDSTRSCARAARSRTPPSTAGTG